MLPCGWRWEAACDLLLSLGGHTQCRQREHPAHPMWARNTELSLQTAPRHPKAGLLKTTVVEDEIFNCFQKECPLSAPKSSVRHLWASSRGVQPGCAFLLCAHSWDWIPIHKKCFWALSGLWEGTISQCLCSQAVLAEAGTSFCSSLAHSKADQGAQNLRLWLAELESKTSFHSSNYISLWCYQALWLLKKEWRCSDVHRPIMLVFT